MTGNWQTNVAPCEFSAAQLRLRSYGVRFGDAQFPPFLLGDDLLEVWDARRGITLGLGSRVSAWTGRKAGRTVAQQQMNQQPLLLQTTFGGAPCVGFDGVDDKLDGSSLGWFPSGNAPLEVWAIVQQDARAAVDTSIRAAVVYGDGNYNSDLRHRRNATTGLDLYNVTVGSGIAANSVSYHGISFVSRHVLRIRADQDVTLYSIDSNPFAQTTIDRNTPDSNLAFGGLIGGGQHWNGSIAYVLFTKLLGGVAEENLRTWARLQRRI